MLWSPSGSVTDLSAILGPAWTDVQLVGLNNRGDIIGYGYDDGSSIGFLLTPASSTPTAAPEPSTWMMMLAGFAGLGFAGYRSGRKSPAARFVAGS